MLRRGASILGSFDLGSVLKTRYDGGAMSDDDTWRVDPRAMSDFAAEARKVKAGLYPPDKQLLCRAAAALEECLECSATGWGYDINAQAYNEGAAAVIRVVVEACAAQCERIRVGRDTPASEASEAIGVVFAKAIRLLLPKP